MHDPVGTLLLGDTGLARIEHFDRLFHRLADGAFGLDADLGPVLPGGVDGGGEIGEGHEHGSGAGQTARAMADAAPGVKPRIGAAADRCP